MKVKTAGWAFNHCETLESRVLMAANAVSDDADLLPASAFAATESVKASSITDPFAGNRAPVNRGDFEVVELPGMAGRYQSLQRRVVNRKLRQTDVKLLKTIVTDPREYDAIRQSANLVLNGKTKYYDLLYRQFIRAAPNADVLYDFLNWGTDLLLNLAAEKPESANRRFGWRGTSVMISALYGYESTGEQRFLDLFVRFFDEVMKNRDSVTGHMDEARGRVMNAWGSHIEGQWTALVTHAGRFGYAAARFALAVNADPALRDLYGDKADAYIAACEEALAEFDGDFRLIKGTNAGYWSRPSFDDLEPLNHAHAVGNAYVMLYALTGKTQYKQRVRQLADFFLASVERNKNGSYSWGYQPTPQQMKGHEPELMFKAEVTLQFPLLVHQYGLAFRDRDIDALARTFTKNVHRGESIISDTIGQPFTFEYTARKQKPHRLTGLLGFMSLDYHRPEIRGTLETILAKRSDFFPMGWMHDWRSMEIYAYRFLQPGQRPEAVGVTKGSTFSDDLISPE